MELYLVNPVRAVIYDGSPLDGVVEESQVLVSKSGFRAASAK